MSEATKRRLREARRDLTNAIAAAQRALYECDRTKAMWAKIAIGRARDVINSIEKGQGV